MNKRLLLTISLIAFLSSGCSKPVDISSSDVSSVPLYGFALKELGNEVNFHSELQQRYIEASDYTTTMGIASGSTAKEDPLPIEITWNTFGMFSDEILDQVTYQINLYEGDNVLPFKTYTTNEKKIDIYNLKINTSYSYDVFAQYSDVGYKSPKSSFKTTSQGPRNLKAENVMNIRDLGGHGIKQGLIYRSGRFNEKDGTTKITQNTIDVMLDDLKIKTEIDLRRDDESGGITSSPLSSPVRESINYYHYPMYYGGENVLTHVGEHSGVSYDNPAEIKRFFDALADINNYPLVFHCAIGKDRTGCMAYLIEALCGMEEEYLYRDYLFSNFAKISGMCEISDIDDKYGATIKEYEGNSLQEKTFNYLNKEIGVSVDNLNTIRSILM